MRTPVPWQAPDRPSSRSELLARGISARKIAGEVRRGTLIRLRRGVFVSADQVSADPGGRQLLLAMAEQLANPGLVASHQTAALAWGLPFAGDARLDPVPTMTRQPGQRRKATDAYVITARLSEQQVDVTPDGLVVTSRARTAVDLATSPLPATLVVLDAALRAECQQFPSVTRGRDLSDPRVQQRARAVLLEAAGRHPSPGLLRALDLADPRRETPIESLSAGHMHEAGIPAPIPQARVPSAIGSLYPDFLWPDHRLIGEADGVVKYQTSEVMLREKRREQVLRDLGFDIVRWTGKEIWGSPQVVMQRIVRALERS